MALRFCLLVLISPLMLASVAVADEHASGTDGTRVPSGIRWHGTAGFACAVPDNDYRSPTDAPFATFPDYGTALSVRRTLMVRRLFGPVFGCTLESAGCLFSVDVRSVTGSGQGTAPGPTRLGSTIMSGGQPMDTDLRISSLAMTLAFRLDEDELGEVSDWTLGFRFRACRGEIDIAGTDSTTSSSAEHSDHWTVTSLEFLFGYELGDRKNLFGVRGELPVFIVDWLVQGALQVGQPDNREQWATVLGMEIYWEHRFDFGGNLFLAARATFESFVDKLQLGLGPTVDYSDTRLVPSMGTLELTFRYTILF